MFNHKLQNKKVTLSQCRSTDAEQWVMFNKKRRITSVVASTDAPYFSRSSTIFIRFFLQAMCNGVKPFYNNLTTILVE